MTEKRYGLDIGSLNIRIASLAEERFLTEKNVITIRDNKYILGYGNDAYEMFEKAPEGTEVCFPVEYGVISDLEKTGLILEHLYKKINDGKTDKGADFLISVPNDTTEVERRAFYELVANSRLKPRGIEIIDQATADAVACHADVLGHEGNLVVNIGAAVTNISVISQGGIVLSRTLKFAGNHISDAIIAAVKQSTKTLIGKKSAEQVKFKTVDLSEEPECIEMSLFGRRIETGLPVRCVVDTEMVGGVVTSTLKQISDNVKIMIDKAPSELSYDIKENGIYIVGGTANMKGIKNLFEKELEIPVNLIKDPANSTIRGITRVLLNSKYDVLTGSLD